METSASCEARSAPSFYPANLLVRIWRGAGVGYPPAHSTSPFGATPPAAPAPAAGLAAPASAACSPAARGGTRAGQAPLLGGHISKGILHAFQRGFYTRN